MMKKNKNVPINVNNKQIFATSSDLIKSSSSTMYE